jgi:hypothetical protein
MRGAAVAPVTMPRLPPLLLPLCLLTSLGRQPHHTQTKDDDELLYYLLQLVQALRFEVSDNSRLSRFLVNRAATNPAFATFLHW